MNQSIKSIAAVAAGLAFTTTSQAGVYFPLFKPKPEPVFSMTGLPVKPLEAINTDGLPKYPVSALNAQAKWVVTNLDSSKELFASKSDAVASVT